MTSGRWYTTRRRHATHASSSRPEHCSVPTDGLRAASQDELSTVDLVSTSGPKSLANIEYFEKQGIKVSDIKERKVVYSGTAREAVKLFPQNVNIAATLAILGVGFDRTRNFLTPSPQHRRRNSQE